MTAIKAFKYNWLLLYYPPALSGLSAEPNHLLLAMNITTNFQTNILARHR